MKRMFLLLALFSLLLLNAQDFKYGITGNFHKGSIVNVHDVSKGKYGGGLGVFGEVPLVENDVFDSAWLYLVGQVEYSTQGENAKAEPDKFATQKFIGDYVNAMVYLKWFFHQGNMKRDVFLFAGPKIDYLVRTGKEVPELYEQAYYQYNLDNNVETFGYGVSVGAGVAITKQVQAYLRFDRGFSKVYTDNPRNTYNRLLAVGINFYLNENWY